MFVSSLLHTETLSLVIVSDTYRSAADKAIHLKLLASDIAQVHLLHTTFAGKINLGQRIVVNVGSHVAMRTMEVQQLSTVRECFAFAAMRALKVVRGLIG